MSIPDTITDVYTRFTRTRRHVRRHWLVVRAPGLGWLLFWAVPPRLCASSYCCGIPESAARPPPGSGPAHPTVSPPHPSAAYTQFLLWFPPALLRLLTQ